MIAEFGLGMAPAGKPETVHEPDKHFPHPIDPGFVGGPPLECHDPLQKRDGILNLSIGDVEGESLLLALEPLCVATGSACNSQIREPSYVLRALGRSDSEAQGSIRFSFGRPTTEDEVVLAARLYRDAVSRLRALAPGSAA